MAEIIFYTKIDCPDYGALEISKVIPFNVLSKFINIQLDQAKAFRDVVCSIVKEESFDFSNLTERDLDFIAQKIAKLYEVESQYLNSRKMGIPRSDSLSGSVKESPKIKGIEESFKKLIRPLSEKIAIKANFYEKIFEPLLKNERMIKQMMGIQSHFDELAKSAGAITRIGEVIKGLSFGKMWSDYAKKNAIEMQKMSLSIIPKLTISKTVTQAYQDRINGLFQNIGLVGEALKPASNFLNITNEALKSIETIRDSISSLREPFQFTNSALIKSEKIVSGANDYFSKESEIILSPPKLRFPKELKKYEEALIENNEESEQILQYEAGESIIVTNNLIRTLRRKIKEDLRKEIINEFAQYSYFFDRVKILGSGVKFLNFLKKFVKLIARDWCGLYWKEIGKKFISKPERVAKSHLGMFISGHFGGIAFVGQEINSGFGYIDLLVDFLGIDYIIEIKMLGSGWSIGWVEGGLDQLDYYMDIYDQNESYLVVLDGRKTNRGRQLRDVYDLENGKVYVVTSRIFWH